MNKRIPVCEPSLNGNELRYVTDALETGWISSSGSYISKFEDAFARYCGVSFGVGVSNGTVALHLALRVLGIGPGDEVIIPSFTMISSAFAVCYCGATPVFVDADEASWNINVEKIEEKISRKTRAIMPVHIFGTVCDMARISELATKYRLFIIEDAAEAHGAELKGRKAGSFSEISAFSFYANKNVACGEGGMVLTNNPELSEKARYFKNLCFPLDNSRRYVHDDIGYNYRLTNLHAAIGLAQVERANTYKHQRIANNKRYRKNLEGIEGLCFQLVPEDSVSVHWMNAILIDARVFGATRDQVIDRLKGENIETRLLFSGMHKQKALRDYGCDCTGDFPVTERLTDQGLYLPSASHLSTDDIDRVCASIVSMRS